jgi:O-antigen/teichoic acid export membrane protein
VLAGGLWTSLSKFIPQLYTLVISIVAARVLGPEGMGRQSFIAFVELTAIFAITAGIPLAFGRFVAASLGAQEYAAARRLIRWAWRTAVAGAVVAAAAFGGIAAGGSQPRNAWVLAGAAAALAILYTVPSTLLLATRRWQQGALIVLGTGLVGTGATVAVLAAGGGIVGMFAVEASVATVSLVVAGLVARRALENFPPGDGEQGALPMRPLARFTALASVTALLDFVVWRRSEFFFLNHYGTDAQIALYSISFAAVTALARLPEPITRVVLPAVATLSGAGSHDRIERGFGRGFRLLVLAAVPLAAVALALGPRTLELVYGSDYRDTGPVVLILLAPFPLLPLLGLASAVLLGLGRQAVNALTMVFAAGLDIGLDFLLIPQHGAIGAAIANACAQTAGCVPMIVYSLAIFRGAGVTARFVVNVLAAGAAAGVSSFGAIRLVSGLGGVGLGIVAGLAAFLIAGRVLHVLEEQDARWLDEYAGRRLMGLVGRLCRAWSPGA